MAPSLISPFQHSYAFALNARLRFSSPSRLGDRHGVFHSPFRPTCALPINALAMHLCSRNTRICYFCTDGVPSYSEPLQQSNGQDMKTTSKNAIKMNGNNSWNVFGDLMSEPRRNIWIIVGIVIVTSGLILKVVPKGYRLCDMVKSSSLNLQNLVPSSSVDGFNQLTLKVLGHNFSIGGHPPGWVYFMLLMAAGFGLFVSEEALNVYVGASLARCLTWNSSTGAFVDSVTRNTSYIVSTILWVYWGVCISDMVPFYAGRITSKTKVGDNISKRLGMRKETLRQLSTKVQRYGDLIGFVERFSIGARNPTSFLAGALGVFPARFFAGVCLGALFTVPLQLIVGCLLRERPVSALAGVAAIVGMWTVFPYIVAGLGYMTYIFLQWYKNI